MHLSEASSIGLDEAIRFRRDVGKKLGRDEDCMVCFTVRDPGEFAEFGASLNMGRVIEVTFQADAFQPPSIIVRGEGSTVYLTDRQVGSHLQLLAQAFEKALESEDR